MQLIVSVFRTVTIQIYYSESTLKFQIFIYLAVKQSILGNAEVPSHPKANHLKDQLSKGQPSQELANLKDHPISFSLQQQNFYFWYFCLTISYLYIMYLFPHPFWEEGTLFETGSLLAMAALELTI